MEQTLTPSSRWAENSDTIVAIATPAGQGGISVIRMSGNQAVEFLARVWRGKSPGSWQTHTAHLGDIIDKDGEVLDTVVATLFCAPNSFTGETVIEISCHGSQWIANRLVSLLIATGARGANPGEFTQRAFVNGRMDLAQAEGVADLIAAKSRAAQRLAISQVKGNFYTRLNDLRDKLVELASLLELELDFSEEDVEFADRSALANLCHETASYSRRLAESYAAGKVFKEGIPVVIAGAPNAGKSTLLNALLDEDRAIVSDIPGTTRDTIEEVAEINGLLFRFVDTAGLRETDDTLEQIGISRARQRIETASIVIRVIDATNPELSFVDKLSGDQITVINKADAVTPETVSEIKDALLRQHEADNTILQSETGKTILQSETDNTILQSETDKPSESRDKDMEPIIISAAQGDGIAELKRQMTDIMTRDYNPQSDLIVTNERHRVELTATADALDRATEAMTAGLPGDLIAQDIREALHHLGAITATIPTDLLLTTIFSRFCIGK